MDSDPAGPRGFSSTHWSLVMAAAQRSTPESTAALEDLCRIYWYPIYAYVRRRGHRSHEAQDLTQEFFTRLLQKDFFRGLSPLKGRFRSFLLVACKHFLSNERDRRTAEKRGGGRPILALDFGDAERRMDAEPIDSATPEKKFERSWALTLLNSVLDRLDEQCRRAGKGELFDRIRVFLTGEGTGTSYAEIATELNLSEGNLRVAVHRLRRRYRALLRQEIAITIDDPEGVEDEIRYLYSALGS